jgi:hypothetical protein
MFTNNINAGTHNPPMMGGGKMPKGFKPAPGTGMVGSQRMVGPQPKGMTGMPQDYVSLSTPQAQSETSFFDRLKDLKKKGGMMGGMGGGKGTMGPAK